jgi:hypothetical protein
MLYPKQFLCEPAGMRDILAHRYYKVNSTLVRATIDEPLESLRATCEMECGPYGPIDIGEQNEKVCFSLQL